MDDRPTPDPRLLEAIEACRPGSDDASDPEMALLAAELARHPELDNLYQRVQKIDRAIGEAFRDVPIPDGLADRLLARLGVSPSSAVPEPPAAQEPPLAQKPSVRPGRRVRRRWVIAGAASALLASAAVLTLAVLLPRQGARDFTASEIRELAADQFGQEADLFGTGPLVSAQSSPQGFRFSLDVTHRGAEVRWRRVRFLERNAVAYDVRLAAGDQATLYVVQYAVQGLPDRLPSTSALPTSQCSTSAWQDGPLLYVLVVHGGRDTYRRFRAPSGTLT